MNTNIILQGDALFVLKTLPDNCIQMCGTSPPYYGGIRYYLSDLHPDKHLEIGLEKTLQEYVARLVEVFREVYRVLCPDGTLWLNLGDCYVSKQLLGMPWHVALALQADGWFLRSDIIWVKTKWLPESIKDRPTKSHEYVFLLSKSEQYYYDSDAIREPQKTSEEEFYAKRNKQEHKQFKEYGDLAHNKAGLTNAVYNPLGRNKRDVWEVSPSSYRAAHFAVMPTALIEPCILAGSRSGDIVLDPFAGSGTTLCVALQHGRRYVGIELNPDYVALANQRISRVQPMLFV
jgi:site-specific DNA-methyltransferase (adenine-specific)